MNEIEYGTLKSYLLGFVASLILTFASYFLVVNRVLSGTSVTVAVGGLAILQAVVQLLFFLGLHNETKPRWNLIFLLFMLLMALILVVGSIWIMYNLRYNLHSV